MKSAQIAILMLAAVGTAQADFSYTNSQKSGQGAGENQVAKYSIKGQKMKQDRGTQTMIWDFGAQTQTDINNSAKTYTVTRFDDMGRKLEGADIKMDVKKTGQKKTINGFNASQMLLTMDVDMPQARQAGMKPTIEMEIWASPDVPGGQELVAFYKKNAARFPSALLGGRGAANNPSMQQAMAKIQKALADLDGVPVMEVVRVKMGGSLSAEQIQQLSQARAQLEAMAKQGGAQAQGAQAALARMGGGGALFETTITGSDFSSAPIPDSVFAIPAGYIQSSK